MVSEFIVTERGLHKSNVFRSLGVVAHTVYFDFRLKCTVEKLKTTPSGRKKEWVIRNNGKLEYTYSEAEKRGIPRSTFMRAIDELIDKGFVDITHQGSGIKGDKSTYAISERWKRYGKDDFVEQYRPKDNRQGRGFKKGHPRYHKKEKQKT